MQVLRRPPGLLAVIRLHHLATASLWVLVPKSPQGTTSKKQKDEPEGEAGNGHPSFGFLQTLLSFLSLEGTKVVSHFAPSPTLRRGLQLSEAQ